MGACADRVLFGATGDLVRKTDPRHNPLTLIDGAGAEQT